MFIEPKKTIDIVLYHKRSKSGNAIRVEADITKIKEADLPSFTKTTFKMRPLTWRIYNDLLRESKTTNPMTRIDETDWATYREKKLIKLLAEWDAKDGDKDIPINEEKIMSLHPLIAENILNEYDRKVYLDEEEQKN